MGGDLLSDLRKRVSDFNNHVTIFDNRDGFYKSRAWARTRAYILKRDSNECQACKARGLVTIKDHSTLIVHHIEPLEYVPSKALDESNLITVCIGCHNFIHGNAFGHADRRNEWDDEYW